MSDNLENECSFTTEEFWKDDPRLKEFEIPEEENQPSFDAIILLIPGSDELAIEDPGLWSQSHLTADDFSRLQSLGLKGKVRAAGFTMSGDAPHTAQSELRDSRRSKEKPHPSRKRLKKQVRGKYQKALCHMSSEPNQAAPKDHT